MGLNISLMYIRPREWKVVTSAGMLKSTTILFCNSSVAFLVKLMARISFGGIFLMSTKYFILDASVVVLPVPAPAIIRSILHLLG